MSKNFKNLKSSLINKNEKKTIAPALIISGENEKVVPLKFAVESKKEGGENCELVVLKKAGHMLPLEHTEQFLKEIVNWLGKKFQW